MPEEIEIEEEETEEIELSSERLWDAADRCYAERNDQ